MSIYLRKLKIKHLNIFHNICFYISHAILISFIKCLHKFKTFVRFRKLIITKQK